MHCRLAMVIFALALAAGGWGLAAAQAGLAAWGGFAAVAALLAFAIGSWMDSLGRADLYALRTLMRKMAADGDLTVRARTGGSGPVADTARAFNDLVASIQTIIGKVYFDAMEVARSAGRLTAEAQQVSTGSEQQRAAATATAAAMGELAAGIDAVASHAAETAGISQQSAQLSEEGAGIVSDAASRIGHIARAVEESSAVIQALGERSDAISNIVRVIREIADQTNLLALNAAIEAARAGEQGRGFAVVADEVRKLAERTSLATGEISAMIGAIQGETQSAIASIDSGSGEARAGADLSRQAAEALLRINQGARETMEKVDAIASAISQQNAHSRNIADHVQEILGMAEDNASVAGKTTREAANLDNLASNLMEITRVFRIGDEGERAVAMHGRMPQVVQQAASDIARALEGAIKQGRISENDLFDEQYQPIPGTRPQKFKTRFDSLTDQLFPAVQEALLERNPAFAYAGAVDRNGYFPTHNKRYSQPLTGNEAHDLVHNRTKRIFDDPVGKRCAAHELPFLVQTYRRDTGEIMHDISAPIYVAGRHWGAFRIGYRTGG